jgi:uncharacterized membrane protein YhaH (DUF805 family)
MKCATCGNDNRAESQFCGICGVSLIVSTASGTGTTASELPMVSFPQAVNLGFKNYFKFNGRATRAESWWWVLFTVLAGIVLAVVDTFTGTMGMFGDSGLLGGLFELATLIPSVALGARRLHDINRTGWWLLLWFVVVVGWIVLIVWAIKQGDKGPNKYGPDPRQATSQQPY